MFKTNIFSTPTHNSNRTQQYQLAHDASDPGKRGVIDEDTAAAPAGAAGAAAAAGTGAGTAAGACAGTRKQSKISFRTDGTLDYDALYEDECESDLSMESHGNVMTHLLSQVKIGMDLTKVVLPTFILERRSLLEMYADYFAHPDLFLK